MVKILNCGIGALLQQINGRHLYCFGSGKQSDTFFEKYSGLGLEHKVIGFIDNDLCKAGKRKKINNRVVPIMAYSDFVRQYTKEDVVLITSIYWKDMLRQMDEETVLNGLECYVDFLVDSTYETEKFTICGHSEKPVIPKVIHYCWFGEKEIPRQFQKYIASWKYYCPDYEIVRWDEKNFDVKKSKFVLQAHQAGKWAFVSDYARLDILQQYGGIYLDTDVELLKSLDVLLHDKVFCGFEQNNYIGFGPGVGAVKDSEVIGEIKELYDTMDFLYQDGTYNNTSCSVYQTQILKERGFLLNNKYQYRDGIAVYPSEVLAPLIWNSTDTAITENTYAIHHYASTWWENGENQQAKILQNSISQLKGRVSQ